MTNAEQREAARQFSIKWKGRGKEDEDARSFWIDILQDVLGMEHVTDRVNFEKKVVGEDGNTKRIDVYIPETHTLIEQKSLGIGLDKPQNGHQGMTPYEQAKYYDNSLPHSEKSRWIITSNFAEIWIYDMEEQRPEDKVVKIDLLDIQDQFHILSIIIDKAEKKITKEVEVSLKAGEYVGLIYDAFLKQYNNPDSEESLKSLNKLCVRLVFCLYAEDAGIFSKNAFQKYMSNFNEKTARKALVDLFKVLDQDYSERDPYLKDDNPILADFPYVNGGLFEDENIEIPPLTEELFDLIVHKASANFDWSQISPTIFGAVFESTLNQETRRNGGMHYTSIENIHKVIDPLFMDSLYQEFEEIKEKPKAGGARTRALSAFQDKISNLKFLDPACGSGNFLTESYLSLRKLENKVIKELNSDFDENQMTLFGLHDTRIKVSISQFYGIEINDFAVTVAKTALWIAEAQMIRETVAITRNYNPFEEFLPLKTNAYIHEGNSLRMDWEEIISKSELNYIMGNPPFVGARQMDKDKTIPVERRHQKEDMKIIFGKLKGLGNLDYVAAWYKKAADYISNTTIDVAFVSTNSITQGEQPGILWKYLREQGVSIFFAYRTFQWDSEAHIKAHVHCVIIGFTKSNIEKRKKYIYEDAEQIPVTNINSYLFDTPDIYITNRSTPLFTSPLINYGSFALDDGNYTISQEEYEEIAEKDPAALKYLRPFIGAQELLHSIQRYCVWLKDISPSEYGNSKTIMDKIERVRLWRANSDRKNTKELAATPSIFAEIRQPNSDYLAIPTVCSEKRRYIPIQFLSKDIIASNQIYVVPNATLYDFGILISNIHNAWIRAVCGRLEKRLRYSSGIVFNNFPWPNATNEQRAIISETAQGILNIYKAFPDCSLDILFNQNKMLPEMKKALETNNKAVMKAYGFNINSMSETDCIAELMKMYQERSTS